ncbi:MAG: hypothetical protein ACK5HY_13860 [Parahaliea sp.]
MRDFYCEVLGLTEGPRPAFNFRGFWLYAQDKAIIHLMEKRHEQGQQASLYLDHVAFHMTGANEYLARLEQKGVAFRANHIADFDIFQVFCHDPCGNGVEVNFRGEVATGWG